MINSNLKRIVVIKDIPSNIIEEAILVLKLNDYGKNKNQEKNEDENQEKNKQVLSSKKKNETLIKEAELIINNYVSKNELALIVKKGKIAIPKTKSTIDIIINLALVTSITLLIFLITRL